MPIGPFAQLCRLSIKQLRNYDALGLLRPSRVDSFTGYRYYRASQARDAMIISLMRSLEVPLSVIQQVLDGQLTELKRHRDDLEADLRRKQTAIGAIERVLQDGLPVVVPEPVEVPDYPVVLAHGRAGDASQIGEVTSACVRRLLPRYPLIGLFPVDFTEPVDIVVAAVDEAGGDVLAGGQFAQVTHVGPYDQIGLTAHGLLAWFAARGLTPTGPIREAYVSDPMSTPAAELITHLLLPLEER